MSEETPSNPFHEELDATVIAKYPDALELDSGLRATNTGEDDLAGRLSDDESLEMTLLDTQDVSAWLEESLFLQPRTDQVGETGIEGNTKNKVEVTLVKEEHPPKAQLSAFFNDFENNAPEPPPLYKKTQEPHLANKSSSSSRNTDLSMAQKWFNEILHSGNRPLVGSSVVAVLALCGAVAYSVIQQERDIASIEPQTLSLLQVTAVPAEQGKAAMVSVEARYCLVQGIRLGAAIQNSALSSIAAPSLQALLADFSQRCENYQFVPETYLKANPMARVELSRQTPRDSLTPIAIEPVVASSGDLQPSESQSESPEFVPAGEIIQGARSEPVDLSRSTQTTKNIQWRLVKLGFYKARPDGKGRIDGFFNKSTQAAVKAFYAQHIEFTESPVEAEILSAIDIVYTAAK